jgi:hypothetical protein
MSQFGGLNTFTPGVVGLVQWQLLAVDTPWQLAAHTQRICDRVGPQAHPLVPGVKVLSVNTVG